RSYRMMQGFGVHTFRLVNAKGEAVFVKFHWTPKYGVHSLVWDEAVKISGADPDFHRRDQWEAIEDGDYPERELGRQVTSADDEAEFVKLRWTPKYGVHSLVWDEAVKISGADPDFHRRDLWEAIEAGDYPEWELGLQVFTAEEADRFSFDILDSTKIIPEELVPLRPVGRMVLNRNPDNFFAETEQVAFCTAHVIPGIDFTNDPLLAGRLHSSID